ncbi:unnamed protein product [Sphenostylis stenocarpa]|uniref:SNRNP25 ubiquitin-like domain-containing protein n=1 Tax=Sphenostylis stenocarpa TaxID=92480 RepID=A0AA86RW80_9FABA|nr:unnamed protein product [Sphenostylis stenocarpa]
MNSATVKDLKLAIKRKKVNDMEQCGMGHRHISWKHVWANYCLSCHNNKLLNDNDALQNFDVRNNSQGLAAGFKREGQLKLAAYGGLVLAMDRAPTKVAGRPAMEASSWSTVGKVTRWFELVGEGERSEGRRWLREGFTAATRGGTTAVASGGDSRWLRWKGSEGA